LTREIDLIEEVARIHGYDAIPEDVGVPMIPSARRRDDRVLEKIRRALTSLGFDEAVTLSAVDEPSSASFSPWTKAEPLRSAMPVIRGADCLRRSLVPSLLAVRRANEALANAEIELFEIARAYLPQGSDLPQEELMLGITGGREYLEVKGAIETIFAELKIADAPEAESVPLLGTSSAERDPPQHCLSQAVAHTGGKCDFEIFDPAACCRLRFRGAPLGYAGRLTADALRKFDLRGPTVAAEIRLAPLIEAACLVPHCEPISPYPAVTRDLNLVVEESVRWADIAATARQQGGPCVESIEYRDTYRDAQRLGGDRKSLLFTVSLRSNEGTLTSREADEIRDRIVAACRTRHGAEVRA